MTFHSSFCIFHLSEKMLTYRDLLPRVRDCLATNDTGVFIKPSPTQYPHQWNWDSAVIALGLAHYDLDRAWHEVRGLLSAQWADGMLPHIIYHHGASAYFPTPDFWQTAGLPHGSKIQSSGYTQNPVLMTCVRRLVERGAPPVDLGAIFDQILRWHRWLHTARDIDGSGLTCLLHPWETSDNSPPWLYVFDQITPVDVPAYTRRDKAHVPPEERPRPEDYERYMYLIDMGRRSKWDSAWLIRNSPFCVQDVFFATLLHRADEDLRWLGQQLGRDTAEIDGWLARTRAVFDARFWNEAQGTYLNWDVRAKAHIPVLTFTTFMPLFAGLASPAQAERLVREHWLNPAEFAPGPDSAYGVPTAAKNAPFYAPRRYWCGPVWVINNWLLRDGLLRYGYLDLADALGRQTLSLIEQHGFREYFDPRDGSPLGARDFAWSAALGLDLAAQLSP
jgi:hypothetical protein